jgi:hypothetical protein
LQSYAELFEEPKELPPSRSCNHSIPLVQGAQPVNIRPYRLSPEIKNEIELQVKEMVDKGIIQHSYNLFLPNVACKKER